jgi:hypothetical protein
VSRKLGAIQGMWSSAGFDPIGDGNTQFTGTFDGQGHTISKLITYLPTAQYVGLFGWTDGSAIRNIGLVDGSVTGLDFVGGLVGLHNGSSISTSYNTGTVTGIGNCIGGLVGANGEPYTASTIDNSYATGAVTGSNTSFYVGGLAGVQRHGVISNSYATGNATNPGDTVGGLVGYLIWGSISNSYSTGATSGTANVGGLVGHDIGGTITNGYWNITANSGLPAVGDGNTTGAIGLTATEMKTASAFSGFDFTNTWVMHDAHPSPMLRSFMTALTVPPVTAPDPAPVSVVDSNPRNQNAIASAVSVMFAMPLQANMANAHLPSSQMRSDASMQDGLAGLNISITGDGVKLPPIMQLSDASEDKD